MRPTTIILVLLLILPLFALADAPPSLTNFQQFYGIVKELPSVMPLLKAKVGDNTYTTGLASDGRFGYAQVFKVFGNNGDTVNFYVANLAGLEVPAGKTTFTGGAVTNIELKYNSTETAAGTSTTATNATTAPATTAPTNGGTLPPSSTITGTEDLPPGQCRQSWECRLWSDCINSRQTRGCYRIDQCDQLQAADIVNYTISMPKPDETRACQTEAEAEVPAPIIASNRICVPGSKRCLGTQLQQCTVGGESWNTLQSCLLGCDSGMLRCHDQSTLGGSVKQKPAPPLWQFLLVGILAVIILTGGLAFFLYHKKYAPAKNYVKQCKEQGFSDFQIRSKLVEQGWDATKIDKMLKS